MNRYSWDYMSKRFNHLEYDLGVYDFSKPIIENTSPIGIIRTSLKTLFSHDGKGSSYMLKTSNKIKSPLMDHVMPLTTGFENVDEVLLRIQTNPWKYSTHFDTYDQHILMLYGIKRWILFKTRFDSVEDEKKYIANINGLQFENLKNVLQSKNIPHHIHTTKPGDCFFIPRGMYHATENVHHGEGTLFLNVVHTGEDHALNERFAHIWPTVTSTCEAGAYY